MTPEKRKQLNALLQKGEVTTFSQIFDQVSKQAVARELGISPDRMHRCIENPGAFRLEEFFKLEAMLGISRGKLLRLMGK